MTFVAFLISLGVIYGFLLTFLSELTKPNTPDTVLTSGHDEHSEQSAAA